MCIVSFAWQAHPRWKLVAIGNRDEMHARPADPLARWESANHLLAGRDAKAGGTWLGISEQGRFAVVTNLAGFGDPDPQRASRGDLLRDFLSGEGLHANLDRAQFSDFNPFNLITVSGESATVHSNRPASASVALPPGIHGLSNGPLDNPWPKSGHLNAALDQWMADGADDPAVLLNALREETAYAPDINGNVGSQLTFEPRNSPVFIRHPLYGTRCSTVVAIDNQGAGSIIERSFEPAGNATGETRLSFSWPQ